METPPRTARRSRAVCVVERTVATRVTRLAGPGHIRRGLEKGGCRRAGWKRATSAGPTTSEQGTCFQDSTDPSDIVGDVITARRRCPRNPVRHRTLPGDDEPPRE